jgi:hypothetical protein
LEESRDDDEPDDDDGDGVLEGAGSGERLTLGALMGAREEGSDRNTGDGADGGGVNTVGADRVGGVMLGAGEL